MSFPVQSDDERAQKCSAALDLYRELNPSVFTGMTEVEYQTWCLVVKDQKDIRYTVYKFLEEKGYFWLGGASGWSL